MQKTDHEVLVLIRTALPHRYRGVARLATECGWIMHMESRRMPPKNWDGDGVLVMVEDFPRLRRFISQMKKRKIPVVDLLDFVPDDEVFRVSRDNFEIGRVAARYFRKKKFRNAAFFSLMHNRTHDMRLDGFSSEWKGAKPSVWLWPDEEAKAMERFGSMDDWLVDRLRVAPKPLALFTWDDYEARRVMDICATAGIKVPDEVAILGVGNDVETCESGSPGISSIDPNYFRIGYLSAATLERLMCGGTEPRRSVHVKPVGVEERGSTKLQAVNAPEMKPVIDYINANLGRHFSAADVAAALGIPRIKFDRMCARHLGHSAGTEIALRRLAKAEQLMLDTDMSIEVISKVCGYCTPSFFTRRFRKYRGTSPSEWRMSMR